MNEALQKEILKKRGRQKLTYVSDTTGRTHSLHPSALCEDITQASAENAFKESFIKEPNGQNTFPDFANADDSIRIEVKSSHTVNSKSIPSFKIAGSKQLLDSIINEDNLYVETYYVVYELSSESQFDGNNCVNLNKVDILRLWDLIGHNENSQFPYLMRKKSGDDKSDFIPLRGEGIEPTTPFGFIFGVSITGLDEAVYSNVSEKGYTKIKKLKTRLRSGIRILKKSNVFSYEDFLNIYERVRETDEVAFDGLSLDKNEIKAALFDVKNELDETESD